MKRFLLVFSIIMSAAIILPESVDAQLFGGKNKRRKSSRKIGSFSGSKRLFNPEISYFAVGGGINALNYFGEIAPKPTTLSTDISFTRPGVNLFLKQKFGDRYSWKVNFMWGRLSASDQETVSPTGSNFVQENANRYLRNLNFRNDIYELSFQGQVDLFKHGGRFSSRPPLNIYAFFGAGIIYHNPKGLAPESFHTGEHIGQGQSIPLGDYANQYVSLRELGTEGQFFDAEVKERYAQQYGKKLPDPYSRIQLVLPVGIGARYKLTNNLDISLDIGYRHTFTDYLDDVSGEYVDLGGYGSLEDARANQDVALAMAMSDMSNQYTQEEFSSIQEFVYVPGVDSHDSRLSNLAWSRAKGYGNAAGIGNDDARRNIRGNRNDNDIYIVTNISVTYILGGGIVRGAKFR